MGDIVFAVKQEEQVSFAKTMDTYDEGGIMTPSFGNITVVSETVRHKRR